MLHTILPSLRLVLLPSQPTPSCESQQQHNSQIYLNKDKPNIMVFKAQNTNKWPVFGTHNSVMVLINTKMKPDNQRSFQFLPKWFLVCVFLQSSSKAVCGANIIRFIQKRSASFGSIICLGVSSWKTTWVFVAAGMFFFFSSVYYCAKMSAFSRVHAGRFTLINPAFPARFLPSFCPPCSCHS